MKKVLKSFKSLFSVIVALITVFAFMPTAFAFEADDVIGNYNYIISNPYRNVDWDTWKPYKGATHVHTVRSDGNVEVDDMLENYYALGYQCLALTDHGTVNYGWNNNQSRLAIFGYQAFVHGSVDELSDARYQQMQTGSDRGGDPMIEIPLGIELNGSSTKKCHVNSYFADCGHGDLEITAKWPEDAVKKCEKAGGVCHINHVGEWTDGKDDIGTYDSAFVEKFSKLFLNYNSCIGMELVNTRDSRTHNDRYLYDQTLKITAPQGVPIWGFCEDDSHDPEDCGNNAQFFVMPQNTWQNIRTSMETGAFFACSKTSKNPSELGDNFNAQGEFPIFSRITVDEEKDQIVFYPQRANVIKMVADGVVLDTKTVKKDNEPIVFDLNNYEGSINSYVRFYSTGAGGICYVQPFLISKESYRKSIVKFNVTPSDAKLTVTDESGNVFSEANSNHEYVLPIGSYKCTAEKADYNSFIQNFTISNNSTRVSYDLKLDKKLIYSLDENKVGIDYEHRLFYSVNPGVGQDYVETMIKPTSGVKLSYRNSDLGFGTGSIISAKDESGNIKEFEMVIFGDANGDSWYDGMDAMLVSLIVNGMLTKDDVGEAVYMAADCNHDGTVDWFDVDILQQAGVLIGEIDQTKSADELLETSSAYVEYLNLIDQSIVTESVTEEKGDTAAESADKEPVQINWFQMILSFFSAVLEFVFNIFTL